MLFYPTNRLLETVFALKHSLLLSLRVYAAWCLPRFDGRRLRETVECKHMNKPEVPSKTSRRKFNKAFKQEAVELWLKSNKAATEVAAELGIHAQRLSAWRKRFAPNNSKPTTPASGVRMNTCANNGIF